VLRELEIADVIGEELSLDAYLKLMLWRKHARSRRSKTVSPSSP
jgi:hypothetical protein